MLLWVSIGTKNRQDTIFEYVVDIQVAMNSPCDQTDASEKDVTPKDTDRWVCADTPKLMNGVGEAGVKSICLVLLPNCILEKLIHIGLPLGSVYQEARRYLFPIEHKSSQSQNPEGINV